MHQSEGREFGPHTPLVLNDTLHASVQSEWSQMSKYQPLRPLY